MVTYQLKISLLHIKPPIWRRVLVPGNLNLARLHLVIQDAMGWENEHLHEFERAGMRFGTHDFDDWLAPDVEDEKKYTLERLFVAKDRFKYVYDMGDSWRHEIRVEKVIEDASGATPRCIAGQRACPPEDCGGVWGYEELLEGLADANHPDHEGALERVGDEWKPEDFDVDAADRLVARHRPNPGYRRLGKRSGMRARPRA